MIKPLGGVILVKPLVKTRTTTGIMLSQESQFSQTPFKGEVLATGEGSYLQNGDLMPMPVKVGQYVLFMDGVKYATGENGKEAYVFIKAADVIAIIDGDDVPAEELMGPVGEPPIVN